MTTEAQAIQINVILSVQEMYLVGHVLEVALQLLQIVSLHAEMESEQELKPVTTESQLRTIRNASMIVQDLNLAGLVQEQLGQFRLVSKN